MAALLEQPLRKPRARPAWDGDDDAGDEFLEDDHDSGMPPDDDGGRGDDGDDSGDGGRVRWVTIATFWRHTEAHLARLRLEADGIDCLIFDEQLVATDWLMANAIKGIKLNVPEPDAAVARSLLAPVVGRNLVEPGDADDGSREPVADGQFLCPRCGSDAIYTTRISRRLAFLSILLLGLPLPMLLARRRTRCAACGFEWT
jgi:predicted RNA-binding Zn-ribbon protein involved in translation (DUF1610 family)